MLIYSVSNSLNMSSCREAAFAKNKAKLESERTVSPVSTCLTPAIADWLGP